MPLDQPYSQIVAASGLATIKIRTGSLMTWIVQQVSIEMTTAPNGSTCSLRKNGSLVTPLIPTGDVAGGDPPITIAPGDTMTVEWAGCTPGQYGKAFAVYDEERR